MSTNADRLADLNRLKAALEALADILDAIERRPHLSLRLAAQNLESSQPRAIEGYVAPFAFAVKAGDCA